MARTQKILDALGSPTAVPFETTINAYLSTLLSSLIGGWDVVVTDKFPQYTRQFKGILDTSTGGTVITHPYLVKVIEGSTDTEATVLAQTFMSLHPTYWYAPVLYRYSDLVSSMPTRSLVFILYNTNATDGAANWQPGFVTNGGSTGGGGMGYNVKDFGALGNAQSNPLSGPQAAIYNGLYGVYGLHAVAGDENDWAAIQAALYKAANTGSSVYIPFGEYWVNKSLQLLWTATPIVGQPSFPLVGRIFGDGSLASAIVGTHIGAGRAVLELLGESNPLSVNTEVTDFTLRALPPSSVDSWCFRVGDAWCGIRGKRLNLEGAHGLRLKINDSSTYAQLCSHFEQIKIITNYNHAFYADDKLAPLWALAPESGGARWDNVHFLSCVFSGLVQTRAEIAQFDNCQFSTNPQRPVINGVPFNDNIAMRIGQLSLMNCYFEDHDIAISILPGDGDIQGVSIRDCHFSGVQNYPGAPLPTYAIKVNANVLAGNIGPITIDGCQIKNSGYTVFAISLTNVTASVTNNTNTEDILNPISTEYVQSAVHETMQVWNNVDPFPVSTSKSTFVRDDFQKLYAASLDDDAIYTLGGLTAANKVLAPELVSVRKGTGIANGETWGVSIQNAGNVDSIEIGWSSTTYQTGGTIPWLANNSPFIYLPTASILLLGFGTAATPLLRISTSAFLVVGEIQTTDFTAVRVGTGIGNAETWGYSAQNNGNTDSMQLGWASTTYRTGGSIPWLPNSSPFLYLPTGVTFNIGFGSDAAPFVTITNSLFKVATNLQAITLASARVGTGIGNGDTWGLTIQNNGNTDSMELGWSSTTYTTGGGLPWLPNSSPFLYVPTGKTLNIGFGTDVAPFVTISNSLFKVATNLQAITLASARSGTGTSNASTWGFTLQNSGNTDTLQLGWSSTTYTTGGTLPWLTNDTPFLYVPSGKTFTMGFGAASTSYQFTAAAFSAPGTITSAGAISVTAGTITASGAISSSGSTITGTNVRRGTGSPEGVVTGAVGDIFERTDGASGTTLYTKATGAGNTGWESVATSGSATAWATPGTIGSTTPNTIVGTSVEATLYVKLDSHAAPGSLADGQLWNDSTRKVPMTYCGGLSTSMLGQMWAFSAATALGPNNTTTETDLIALASGAGTLTFPASDLNIAGRGFQVRLMGSFGASGTGTLVVKIYLHDTVSTGDTLIAQSTSFTPAASSTSPYFVIDFTCVYNSGANAMLGTGLLAAPVTNVNYKLVQINRTGNGWTTTNPQTLKITAKFSVATVNDFMLCDAAIVHRF